MSANRRHLANVLALRADLEELDTREGLHRVRTGRAGTVHVLPNTRMNAERMRRAQRGRDLRPLLLMCAASAAAVLGAVVLILI